MDRSAVLTAVTVLAYGVTLGVLAAALLIAVCSVVGRVRHGSWWWNEAADGLEGGQ